MVAKGLIYPEDRTLELNDPSSRISESPPLRPYKHQVGGHAAIFELDSDHICKPFNQTEADFYQNMPVELLRWVPKFYFKVELKPNNLDEADLCVSRSDPNHRENRQLVFGTEEVTTQYDFIDVFSGLATDANINPWSLECYLRSVKSDPLNRFMVFENLSRGFLTPNVLDMKLGVQQYSDNANDEKKKRMKTKCDQSTSKKMGMRLCGLQYFDESLNLFNYIDKYYGRNLSETGLSKLLSHFFRSKGKIRTSDCLTLIDQIESIRRAVESRPGLRLLGVSLLVIMEGKTDVMNPAPPIARLIDFAHASIDPNDSVPDLGCLMGLQNLILAIKNIASS